MRDKGGVSPSLNLLTHFFRQKSEQKAFALVKQSSKLVDQELFPEAHSLPLRGLRGRSLGFTLLSSAPTELARTGAVFFCYYGLNCFVIADLLYLVIPDLISLVIADLIRNLDPESSSPQLCAGQAGWPFYVIADLIRNLDPETFPRNFVQDRQDERWEERMFIRQKNSKKICKTLTFEYS